MHRRFSLDDSEHAPKASEQETAKSAADEKGHPAEPDIPRPPPGDTIHASVRGNSPDPSLRGATGQGQMCPA